MILLCPYTNKHLFLEQNTIPTCPCSAFFYKVAYQICLCFLTSHTWMKSYKSVQMLYKYYTYKSERTSYIKLKWSPEACFHHWTVHIYLSTLATEESEMNGNEGYRKLVLNIYIYYSNRSSSFQVQIGIEERAWLNEGCVPNQECIWS